MTKQAGLDPGIRATGCTAGDYDNDGYTDLALTVNGHVRLFHNEHNGTFTDVTDAAGLAAVDVTRATRIVSAGGVATGLTFIDYDHDGDLDLYVVTSLDSRLRLRGISGSFRFERDVA